MTDIARIVVMTVMVVNDDTDVQTNISNLNFKALL